MEWWVVFAAFILGLIILLCSGFPIAFGFLMMNLLGSLVFMGTAGLQQMTLQIFASISTFTLAPIPLFILMGELMFHSGIANKTIDVMDKWLGRLPGRLSLLATGAGVLFAALSGSTLANTAMLGTVLLPEMQKRGYKTPMAVGPIIGVGGLAMLIPPSSLAVVLASIGHISVSKILIGGVIPGLLLGFLIACYVIGRCMMDPTMAPRYEVEETSILERLVLTVRYVLPLGFIIFMVLGLMLLGVATPTEAAASGAIGTIIVTWAYRRLSWKMVKASLVGTLEISVMVFMIIAGSNTFSSLLAYTGATQGLLGLVEGLRRAPALHPHRNAAHRFLPGLPHGDGFDHDDLHAHFHAHREDAGLRPGLVRDPHAGQLSKPASSPPRFGMLLFVMKGVAPKLSMKEIVYAAFPFVVIELVAMAMIIAFPPFALWLPSFVK